MKSSFSFLPLLSSLLIFIPVLHAEPLLKNRVFVIDAGHGVINYEGRVINPGKENSNGSREHELTLKMALKLGKILQDSGAKVFYTRSKEDYWRQAYSTIEDNKARAYLANEVKADAFISIHCDWNPSRKYKGVTTIYAKKDSDRLSHILHGSLLKKLKSKDRKVVFDSYTVLDTAEVPAVLIETGFLSNREESKKLAKSSYQQSVAEAIATGIKTYFK